MAIIDFKLVILHFCILSVVLNSGSGAPLEKHEFEVRRLRVKDENGGKDWILELKGDIIIDQYREGVSSFHIILIASLIAIMLPGSHSLLLRANEAAMDEKSHPVRHRQFLLSATEKRDRRRTSKIDVPTGPLCQVCAKVERKKLYSCLERRGLQLHGWNERRETVLVPRRRLCPAHDRPARVHSRSGI